MNSKTWDRIKYWKEKYDKTPNGWAVSMLIGKEYNALKSRNKKNG